MKACSHPIQDCVCKTQLQMLVCPYSYDEMDGSDFETVGCVTGDPHSEDDPRPPADISAELAGFFLSYPDCLDRLRALRLWHWKQVTMWRTMGRTSDPHSRRTCDESADRHLKFVQTLNDFFPVGDTAERDADKETK